ncbi:hypothetical protein V501_00127 [Pseudogymnoascus sp. VKM F-4519 (FW-2642)]|nr:hypothetical protein V501_00127 [Pseudogymnoascus sp. VKM F-4519 (FW-2642)]
MTSPEQKWASMSNEAQTVTEVEVAAVYNQLEPVDAKFLLGDWTGGDLDTGHIAHKALQGMRWAGKSFRSVDDVDPIIVYDDHNNRVWNKDFGHAILREVKFRGIISTAMIYDQFPIIDHFRCVNNDMVAGAMDTKQYGDAGVYYFFLRRIK